MDETNLVESILPAYEQLKIAIRTNDLICITGPPAVGKTTLAKSVFHKNSEALSAFISCFDVTTSVQLYSKVCSKFHAAMNICKKDKAGKLIGQFRVDQVIFEPDFPQYCEEYCKYAEKCHIDRLFVVIDQFELARGTQLIESIALLMTIPKLGIIIITNRSPTTIIDYLSQCSPRIGLIAQDRMLPIFIKNWSKSDIIRAILEHPPKKNMNLYKKFVQNVVNILYLESTRNFRDIKIYCQERYPDFLDHFESKIKKLSNDTCTEDDIEENYVGTQREVSQMTLEFLESFKNMIKTKDMTSWRSEGIETKLTYNEAFLMIAAYVAAHTSSSDDKRNFGISSRSKGRRSNRNDENTDLARTFTMERLLQIYLAMLRSLESHENIITNNDSVLSDIERFELLDILQVASGDGFSSDTRYRLSTSIRKEDIKKIAEEYEYSEQFAVNIGEKN